MKNVNVLLLFVILLSSCAPAVTAIPTSAPTQTFTPVPTATQTPSPTPTIFPTPTQIGGGIGKLIFEYSSSEFEKDFPDLKGDRHVFIANNDGSNISPITNGLGGDNSLDAISSDGTKALIVSKSRYDSKTSNLYLVNLNSLDSEPTKIAQNMWSAKWLDDTKIICLGQGDKGIGIYIINADGTNPVNIENGNKVSEILTVNKDRVYWNTISTRHEGNLSFISYYVWWTKLDGSETDQLTYNGKQIATDNFLGRDLIFSSDGTKIAWVEKATETFHHNYLRIALLSDIEHALSIDILTPEVDLKWLLDGKSILVFDWGSVSKSNKNNSRYGFYQVSAESGTVIKNYHLPDDTMGIFGVSVWLTQCTNLSPDDKLLPCLTFEEDTTARGLHFAKLNFLDLETSAFYEVSGFNFMLINPQMPPNISWIR